MRLRDALLELVAERPFSEVRIERIAEAAGLSRSAFYFYFRDKRELLMQAAGDLGDELYEQADTWWHGDGEPADLIRTALSEVSATWTRHTALVNVAIEVSTYDEGVREYWRSLVRRFVEATADHIEREQAAGRIERDLRPLDTSEILIWGAERTLYVFVSSGTRDPAEVVDALTRTWMRALYGRGPAT